MRQVTTKQVERMYELFKGLHFSYGIYDMSQAYYEGKKLRGQPKSITEDTANEVFDKAFWLNKFKMHLTTDEGLGVVPVNEDAECIWGCIDVDKYDLNHEDVLRRIIKYNLPLVTTVSKSGGLHLWCLVKKPVKAFIMINYLKNAKALLGLADVEVFPKQTKVLYEAGDSGSWVNIPMAGNGTRYAIKLEDERVKEIKDLEEFLDYAEASRIEELKSSDVQFECEQVVIPSEFKEAPPCLQGLMEAGFPEGSRNIVMFNIGIYLKKAYADSWETEFEKYNQRYGDPPLTASEVLTIQKSVRRKDYNYQCNQQPLCAYCNVSKCKMAKYGVGDTGMDLRIESISKIDASPATWFATVGEHRLTFTTEELMDQKKYQLKCMEALNRMPPRLKDKDWQTMIDLLIQDAVIIPAAPDAGTEGTFKYFLEDYCTTMQSPRREDVLCKRAFRDDNTGFTYFSLTDFMLFLKKNRFTEYTKSQVSAKLKDMGGGHDFFNIKGRGINVHYIPNFAAQTEKFTVPEFTNQELI